MNTSYRFLAIALAFTGLISSTAGAQEKYAIKVGARTLKRGTAAYTIRAISAPEIAKPGTLKGNAVIDVAEIDGEFCGELAAHLKLVVNGSGRVSPATSSRCRT